MKEHCYWPLVSDFNNVLSHKSVALVFLRDDALIDMWFQFLSMLQGMLILTFISLISQSEVFLLMSHLLVYFVYNTLYTVESHYYDTILLELREC